MSDAALPFLGGRAGAAASPRAPLLPMRARGLTLRRGGVAVVDRIDLDLGLRGCTAILGPNGAGKSLLLRLLHGLEPPEAGAVTWNGAPASREVTARQALVFQTPVLLRRSVGANLDFVLRARRRDRGLRAALLDRVGLGDKADRPARLLSGGEKQRLALARALATGPDVLFLDEPTASLDPGSVLMIERIVREEAERGTRLVIVTHDVAQARRLADDVVFLHRGRVIEHAPTDTFFAAPAAEAARDFLAGRIVL